MNHVRKQSPPKDRKRSCLKTIPIWASPRGAPGNQRLRNQCSDDNRQSLNQTETVLHGLLQESSKDPYLSTAGLIYGPDSVAGHRLHHGDWHVEDQPQRRPTKRM